MVARISTGKSIIGLINYNENKVAKGDARLLAAQNMVLGKKESELTYDMKISTFQRILDGKKSRKLEKPILHISLNFDPGEKMTDDLLKEMARKYMEGMGYHNQPYMVYRHEDTHHPHIHIVSVKVDREGKKINDSFYKLQSEKIRKTLEVEYNLVKASEKIKQELNFVLPLPIAALNYSKGGTKKAITNVVHHLLSTYKVSSLQEFQMLLKQYNVNLEHISGTYNRKSYEGLVYSLIDSKGSRVGVGIKASSIYRKPTLQKLKIQFAKNSKSKNKLQRKTATEIEKLLRQNSSITKEDFTKHLTERGITALYPQGKEGEGLNSIIYIDHLRKAVFEEKAIGKPYTWNALEKRFAAIKLPNHSITKPDKNHITGKNSNNHICFEKTVLKAALTALIQIYDRQRNFENSGEYFESQYIRKLNQIDLANPLVKQFPTLTHKQAKDLEVKFKEYKNGKLKDIENNETAFFKNHVQKAFNLIDHFSHLSPQKKLAFLYRYQIEISREKTTFVAKHIQGEHLKLGIKSNAVKKLLSDKGTLPKIDKKNLVPFTGNQRGLLDKILVAKSAPQASHNQHIFSYEIFKNPLTHEANNVTSNVTLADIFQANENEKEVESTSTKNNKRREIKIS
jgi:hypothetical protein